MADVESPPPARILVVDDEPDLRALVQRYLQDQGLVVRTLPDTRQLESLLARERFDVLVLDVMLPGEDGLAACRRLRDRGEIIPVLMLTARGDPVDRIIGLEMGADDYLPKPFNPRELLARIQSQLRRQRLLGAQPLRGEEARLRFGEFELLLDARRLLRGGREIDLTSSEFGLLAALASHANRALGRERLIELAHGRDHNVTDRSVDVQIMRLRRLIEVDPSQPRHLRTVWGVGYMFVPNPVAPTA